MSETPLKDCQNFRSKYSEFEKLGQEQNVKDELIQLQLR